MDKTAKAAPKLAHTIQTNRLTLRMAKPSDIPAILRYYKENEVRFAPTDPPKPEGFYTETFWTDRIQKIHKAWESEQSLDLCLFETGTPDMVGTVSFSQMFRGPFHACYLGYAIGGRHEGKGLMTEALEAAVRYVFDELNFHRIMANHLPENERSARVLKRLGFVVEGEAKDYLFINGEWRDHMLNALTNAKWRQNA